MDFNEKFEDAVLKVIVDRTINDLGNFFKRDKEVPDKLVLYNSGIKDLRKLRGLFRANDLIKDDRNRRKGFGILKNLIAYCNEIDFDLMEGDYDWKKPKKDNKRTEDGVWNYSIDVDRLYEMIIEAEVWKLDSSKERNKLDKKNFPYGLVVSKVYGEILLEPLRPKQISDIDKKISIYLREHFVMRIERSKEIASLLREKCIDEYFDVIPISPFGDKRISLKKEHEGISKYNAVKNLDGKLRKGLVGLLEKKY